MFQQAAFQQTLQQSPKFVLILIFQLDASQIPESDFIMQKISLTWFTMLNIFYTAVFPLLHPENVLLVILRENNKYEDWRLIKHKLCKESYCKTLFQTSYIMNCQNVEGTGLFYLSNQCKCTIFL